MCELVSEVYIMSLQHYTAMCIAVYLGLPPERLCWSRCHSVLSASSELCDVSLSRLQWAAADSASEVRTGGCISGCGFILHTQRRQSVVCILLISNLPVWQRSKSHVPQYNFECVINPVYIVGVYTWPCMTEVSQLVLYWDYPTLHSHASLECTKASPDQIFTCVLPVSAGVCWLKELSSRQEMIAWGHSAVHVCTRTNLHWKKCPH